ncbi:MAG: dipeptide/oligopeptide/nickel ABC transporter ATP-binding protein [Pseudomonadota bacterium]
MLAIEGVGKCYKTGWRRSPVEVLRDIRLQVHPGEILGLCGPSGSGKTTLARMIPDLVRPSTGKIRFRGEDITRLTGKQRVSYRRKVQIVFQNPLLSLDPKQSVFDAVAEPLKVHGLVESKSGLREKVGALLSDCGLPEEIGGRLPREISGGQAQRVVLARALSVNPELIIGDEMTSMLDVSVQTQILHLLQRLRKDRGLTLMLISHDRDLLRAVCNRVAMLEGGRIQEVWGLADR